ncbi:transcription factor IIIB 90 kDa subunit-like [Myzus persicae]|uniref:transcription factor IIIB 90 kDa subunit-like n=1 Tax=Myzus persicae TaxID=13164 RepID=UPI000B9393F0|nr:transcription factor IIIB 90 kDa subunit-like [Myzus persicae]XP_022161932.1 transcription factor IIIB 90 kDa subunit-like [Myzus persicae]XP_022161933.1 transcription factor IIIB 90 kDa subunit-like [Myzus persicae]XP_022161934.1 transcription factor IIIB 90 kDa subunit-like [Myzus persicae]
MKCSDCGSLNLDSSDGPTVCMDCGGVMDESHIVSEVQFEETDHGSRAVGQFLSSDSQAANFHNFGSAFHHGMKQPSREMTQAKARRGIQVLSNSLNLSPQTLENACVYYNMALKRHFTRGRKNALIYAASVYIACRMEGTMHMLLDVADASEVNAFELGKTYLRMMQTLTLTVPSLDPSIFLMRFVNSLDFGDKTHIVYTTAMRLLQRMMRDSIHTGRRPSSLCGAALLISGRMHDFNRTTDDIIKVVHCHHATLKKRLLEFKDTPSSMLSIEEFMTVDLEETHDPPSYRVARARDKERIDKFFEANDSEKVIDEVKTAIEKELSKKKNTTVLGVNLVEIAATASPEPGGSCKPVNVGPSLEIMGLSENKRSYEDDDEEDSLCDVEIDEDEIDSYILSKESHQLKRNMWMKMHGTAFRKMQLSREERAKNPKVIRAKENKAKNSLRTPAKTAAEAVERVLKKKKLSSKINYDILDNLDSFVNSDSSSLPGL